MGLWSKIAVNSLIVLIDIVLFFTCPAGLLMFVAVLPYTLYSLWHFKRWTVIFSIILTLSFVLVFVILPIMTHIGSVSYQIYQFYKAIYPKTFNYTWAQDPPALIYSNLAVVFLLVLIIEGVFFVISKFADVRAKKAQMIAYSSFLSVITFIYTIIAYIAMIYPNFYNILEEYILATAVYDFLFKFLPFIAVYFILKYIYSIFKK